MNAPNLQRASWRMSGRAIAFAVVAAVALRAVLLFVALPHFQEASPTLYKAEQFPDWYDLIAMNLVEGHGYRFSPDTTETMLRAPGWILMLAGIFRIFGHSLVATKAFNLVFSLVTAYLVSILGKRVTGSARLGVIAAVITFFHPAILVADSRGGLESFFTLFLVAYVLLIYRALETEAIGDYLIAGAVLGVVLLIKSTVALFPPLFFLYAIGRRPTLARVRATAVRVGAMALVAGAVLSPWIIRNYALSGEFVPTMSVGGKAAFEGLYIVTHRHSGLEHYALVARAAAEEHRIAREMGLKFKPGYYQLFYTISDEVRFYNRLGDMVKRRYVEEPSILLDAIGYNSLGFWIQGRTKQATTRNTIVVLPLLVLAIWGAYLGWRQTLIVGPILVFVAAFFVVHVPIVGQARYHVPLIPLLAVLACIPFRKAIDRSHAPPFMASRLRRPAQIS